MLGTVNVWPQPGIGLLGLGQRTGDLPAGSLVSWEGFGHLAYRSVTGVLALLTAV